MDNLNIKHYEKIREILRSISIYGCVSRYDFQDISPRKYDDTLRIIKNSINEKYISDKSIQQVNTRKKYIKLDYNYFETVGNYLVDSYYSKSFTVNDISLFFRIQQIIKEKGNKTTLDEILDELNMQFKDDIYSLSTVQRNVDKMVNWGIISKEYTTRDKAIISIVKDIFEEFKDGEINEIYNAVHFFSGTTFPCVPGNYLENSLKQYIKYERFGEEIESIFLHKNYYFHQVIDECIVWKLLCAIKDNKQVEIQYKTKKNDILVEKFIEPVKIILDLSYGRWYLVGKDTRQNKFKNLSCYPIHRIIECHIKDTQCSVDYKSQFDNEFSKAWNIVGIKEDQQTDKVKLKFYTTTIMSKNNMIEQIKATWNYVDIFDCDDLTFIAEIEVNDIRELKPWIRQFGEMIEVMKDAGNTSNELRTEIKSEWEALLNEYEE